jgi:glutamyl-tRNA synthetase
LLRFAPSPTGDMHIGNLRVAIFNYIISQQKKEKLLIRIEDTDSKRNVEGKDKDIVTILELFSIKYDNLIYQSNNLKFHQQFAMKLLSDKNAFCCFCTDDELNQDREKKAKNKIAYRYSGKCENLDDSSVIDRETPFAVRIKRADSDISFKDEIKGDFSFASKDIDSFIIMKKDNTPTYNFACAVDDMLSDISLIIRGEDHLSNTPRQILIREHLGYEKNISYIHLPIILNMDGKKMSKRDDSSSVAWLLKSGFLPEAIANYLVLLGGSFKNEIFTIDEAIEFFNIDKISKSSPKFDIDKLKFINKKHMLLMENEKLSKMVGYEGMGRLAKLFIEEADTIIELKEKIDRIFNTKGVLEDFADESLIIRESILSLDGEPSFDEFKKLISDKTGLKAKQLFKPLRYLLTGSTSGPNLSDIYPHLIKHLKEIVK